MTETKAAEPSMEEILASIRQIINSNDAPGEEGAGETPALESPAVGSEYAAPDGESDPADEAPEDDDVMELTSILEEESPIPAPPEFTPPPVAAPAPEPIVAPAPSFVAPAPIPTAPISSAPMGDALITGMTAAAATAAFSGLANTLYQERAEHSLPIGNNNRTLESMVVEAIKPLLKDWCDEHLPSIVERVVQAEVEKLTKRIGG